MHILRESSPPASLFNTWQIFEKNIRYNLHYNCKNMSEGLPLFFSASAVSSKNNNLPFSSLYEGRTESHEQLFFACELGIADEGECGGRWNQLLCYP